ncbi:MAG: HAD domain-containing protein [Labilithrix sp.]
MKVVFLDIDGVLNSQAWFDRQANEGLTGFDPSDEEAWLTMLDPDCVARLDRLVAAHDAKVVISSSWRQLLEPSTIARLLARRGFRGEVIGATTTSNALTPTRKTQRGDQIAHWLATASVEGDVTSCVTSFVILDDDEDMVHLVPRHVKTAWAKGLTEDDAARASELLAERLLERDLASI